MAQFQVIRAIEHNQKLYLPRGSTAPDRIKSAAHGQDIAVDATGVIELNDREAAALSNGQVLPLKAAESRETGSAKK